MHRSSLRQAQLPDILAWFRKTHQVLHACWNPCMLAMLHTLARIACSGDLEDSLWPL